MNGWSDKVALATMVVVVLSGGACSNDDTADVTSSPTSSSVVVDAPSTDGTQGEAEAPAYVDALVEDFVREDQFRVGEDQYRCISQRIVETLGASRLNGVGTPSEVVEATHVDFRVFVLDQPDAEAITEGFFACAEDFEQKFADVVVAQSGVDLGAPEAQCVRNFIANEQTARERLQALIVNSDVGILALESDLGEACFADS